MQEFPELDRVAWLRVPEAIERVVQGQVALLERLAALRADA